MTPDWFTFIAADGTATALQTRHILGVVAATRHAVALDLLSPQEAGEIWAGVARRHPDASWCHRDAPAFA